MQPADIWKRIEDGEPTSALEAWTLLGGMLAGASQRGDNPELAIEDAAIAIASALDRLDQRATERDTLLFELRSERGRGRCRELDELLVRMLDPEADNRLATYPAAIDALGEIEPAIRAASTPSEPATDPAPPPADAVEREAGTRPASGLGCGLLAVIPVLVLAAGIIHG